MEKNNDWREAIVCENLQISRGSFWLKLQSTDNEEIVYQPGNVLSLSITDSYGYLHRKSYTISKSNIEDKTFEHLYKLIPLGNFSNKLSRLRKGDKINFRGVFHKPIHEEISNDVKEIVLISTGSGIGPIYGFAEKALRENLFSIPITIYAGFREFYDISLRNELDILDKNYENFKWFATLTQPLKNWEGLRGRVTESVPPLIKDLNNTHFHLIGNGRMVFDFMEVFKSLGVPEKNISKETFFHHGYSPDNQTVENIIKNFSL